jgi:hypothetical protein
MSFFCTAETLKLCGFSILNSFLILNSTEVLLGKSGRTFLPGSRTSSIGRWNFFSKAVELFQALGGKSSTGKSLLLSEL